MKIVIFFAMLLASATVHGQSNFSGSWKLNASKSDFHNIDPASFSETILVEQKSGTFTYQIGKFPKITLKIDSTTETEVTRPTRKIKTSMKPTPDKTGLIQTSTYIYPDGQSGQEIKRVRIWSLSDQNKLLVLSEHIELNDGQMLEAQVVYDRQ